MIGKVVHHQKFGYGVTWRTDKFGRISAKFQSGKEVGGFAPSEVRAVEKPEFEKEKVLDMLKQSGLDAYVKLSSEEPAAEAILNNNEQTLSLFETMSNVIEESAPVALAVKETKKIVESSELDSYTKQKVLKRLSKMDDIGRLRSYVENSVARFRKIDEDATIMKLNIRLAEVITELLGEKENA